MITLRYYQQKAIDRSYEWMQSNNGNCLLALPTGAGKAIIIAKICKDSLEFPNQHILCATHSKELVAQNAEKFQKMCPNEKVGIYCAGLGKKEIRKITFASIASIHKIKTTPWVDLLIIDEVQLVNDEKETSMYASLIIRLQELNPNLRVIGLSATIFRLGSGMLHEGENRLFQNVAFDQPISELIEEGYLARLISKSALAKADINNISIVGGEFQIKSAESEFDRTELTQAAIEEAIRYGSDRHSWIVFCITKEHAVHVRDALRQNGIEAEAVTDSTPKIERDHILDDFKSGKIRALCNINIASVGFDAPCVDMIIVLRPTQSPGWHVQALGRGTRPIYADGFDLNTKEGRLSAIASSLKPNCLVLDHAGNLERLGPITHVLPPYKRSTKISEDEKNGRTCPLCQSVAYKGSPECLDCGYVFPINERKIKHSKIASTAEVMDATTPVIGEIPNWFLVKQTTFEIHEKFGGNKSLKVTYQLKHTYVQEWLAFGHEKDYPKKLAKKWWQMRGGLVPVPESAEEAMSRMEEVDGFRTAEIKVQKEDQYKRVLDHRLVPSDGPMTFDEGNLGIVYVQEAPNAKSTVAV